MSMFRACTCVDHQRRGGSHNKKSGDGGGDVMGGLEKVVASDFLLYELHRGLSPENRSAFPTASELPAAATTIRRSRSAKCRHVPVS
jgi:hypothetical protein